MLNARSGEPFVRFSYSLSLLLFVPVMEANKLQPSRIRSQNDSFVNIDPILTDNHMSAHSRGVSPTHPLLDRYGSVLKADLHVRSLRWR